MHDAINMRINSQSPFVRMQALTEPHQQQGSLPEDDSPVLYRDPSLISSQSSLLSVVSGMSHLWIYVATDIPPHPVMLSCCQCLDVIHPLNLTMMQRWLLTASVCG